MWVKNRGVSKSFCWLFLLLALRWAFAPPVYSSPLDGARSGADSEYPLNRLITISNELAQLNEKLQNELDDSRKNSRELQNMLEASRRELRELRSELESLQGGSTALLNTARNSVTELDALSQALTTAESSLASLEKSFAVYRQSVELRIQSLEKSGRFWRVGFFAACGLALGGIGAALIVNR